MDDLGRSKGMTIVPLSHFSIVPCCTYGLVPKAIKRREKKNIFDFNFFFFFGQKKN